MGRIEKDRGVMRIGPYLIPLGLGKKWLDTLYQEHLSQQAWIREQVEKYVGEEE